LIELERKFIHKRLHMIPYTCGISASHSSTVGKTTIALSMSSGVVSKNVKVAGELVSNPKCIALANALRYMVWLDKFRPDVATHYDGSSNPVKFLQLYIVTVQAARGDQHVMANWFPMALKDAAQTRLMNLPPELFTSWRDLC
jgi:hypothetical protein